MLSTLRLMTLSRWHCRKRVSFCLQTTQQHGILNLLSTWMQISESKLPISYHLWSKNSSTKKSQSTPTTVWCTFPNSSPTTSSTPSWFLTTHAMISRFPCPLILRSSPLSIHVTVTMETSMNCLRLTSNWQTSATQKEFSMIWTPKTISSCHT